ncbi:putative mitochondrial chaperone bcs1 protein [Phaeoacremonium minimum UCRPA7]|uniref:Putative mitochondrial chaperone bcs1 protein n=1 Tax=Phaeoacremonium minimum (strain UCR-PA7) TaxID=1286976 RepID=R8BKC8_PHAM7|nr:putative mitochondrial chaperone bcs1 protein [Phaeoacremonium minimum UCRPA7]EON99766.1 putative mitochondrial chaperone bcs1 protein [Phaeoacremonium minimum UCRPA7]
MADPASCSPAAGTQITGADFQAAQPPQLQLLDFFFPGFSVISGAVVKYLKIDLNVYIPMLLLLGGLIVAWRYFSEYFWGQLESHFMSTVDIRTDDEIYNMIMAWVAAQRFAQKSRRFVVNTNLNSRSWFLWRWDYDDDEDDGAEDMDGTERRAKKKALQYTPTFGSHYFWYKGRLLIFRRSQNREQAAFLVVSEREEVSVSCFGRNPWVLKELLLEARAAYMKKDEHKTLIYRGTTKAGSTEPTWQRCMSRTSRPFSTVILNEKVKNDLIDDVTDYLNPATRRWYSNRGIPYRRGYLLYGPPGTGKSSLSLALAGFFKMRIYIVSLSSVTANEENLAALFAELPRRCVVLLEDIDTAGLTHTREENKTQEAGGSDMVPGQVTPGQTPAVPLPTGRLSLSGLLNILDGVASQEGRVLIMTTNHLEKLDKALIRPGRVDMIVKFDLADGGMIASIFRAIFAPLEGDDRPKIASKDDEKALVDPEEVKKQVAAEQAQKQEILAKVDRLAEEFAAKIPSHEFSPAELQGYLMKNKRDPDAAVAGAQDWIISTRREKKEKELKEAEEKRKKEEEENKKEEEAKKKAEEEKQLKDEEEKKKRKEAKKKQKRKEKARKSGKASDTDSSSEDSSDSEVEKDDTSKTESKPEDSIADTVEKAEPVGAVDQVKKVADGDRPRTGTDSGYGTP